MTEQLRLKKLLKTARDHHAEENHLILIPKKLSKKVYAYGAMKHDLELILDYIKELKKNSESIASSGMTYAMIILYGKCFTDASKDGFPKLESSDIFKNEEELLKHHNYLMNLRHKFLAHRSYIMDEIAIVYLAVKKDNNRIAELKYKQMKLSSFSKNKLTDFMKVFHYVEIQIEQKLEKSSKKLYDGIIKKYSKEEIEKLIFNDINLEG